MRRHLQSPSAQNISSRPLGASTQPYIKTCFSGPRLSALTVSKTFSSKTSHPTHKAIAAIIEKFHFLFQFYSVYVPVAFDPVCPHPNNSSLQPTMPQRLANKFTPLHITGLLLLSLSLVGLALLRSTRLSLSQRLGALIDQLKILDSRVGSRSVVGARLGITIDILNLDFRRLASENTADGRVEEEHRNANNGGIQDGGLGELIGLKRKSC